MLVQKSRFLLKIYTTIYVCKSLYHTRLTQTNSSVLFNQLQPPVNRLQFNFHEIYIPRKHESANSSHALVDGNFSISVLGGVLFKRRVKTMASRWLDAAETVCYPDRDGKRRVKLGPTPPDGTASWPRVKRSKPEPPPSLRVSVSVVPHPGSRVGLEGAE